MARANPHRGEAPLVLGDATYRLRPTFTALAEIEAEAGPLFALIDRASSGDLRLSDMVTVLHACARAGGAEVSREAFGEAIVAQGITSVTGAFRDVLTRALAGPDDPPGD